MTKSKEILYLFERHNLYPVLQSGRQPQVYIPYNIIAPHEAQAMRNHSQTLQRLAERGGLGWMEILAVLNDKTWKEMGWKEMLPRKEAEEQEKKAKEAVLAYIKERRGSCGCG